MVFLGFEIFPASTVVVHLKTTITSIKSNYYSICAFHALRLHNMVRRMSKCQLEENLGQTTWVWLKDRKICGNARFLWRKSWQDAFFCNGQTGTSNSESVVFEWQEEWNRKQRFGWFHQYFQWWLTCRYEGIGGRCCIFGVLKMKNVNHVVVAWGWSRRDESKGTRHVCNWSKMKGERLTWEWIRQVLMFVFGEEENAS